jgi:hypothetical protein
MEFPSAPGQAKLCTDPVCNMRLIHFRIMNREC